jgi:hypothetical protein
MKRILHIALAIALAACGDDGAEPDCADQPDQPWCEHWPAVDAASFVCDPVAQTGCLTAEKCTWQDVTDELGRIACVPDGTVAIAGRCTLMPPGETAGYDDCVRGAYCLSGTCQEICTDAPDSCDTTTSACSSYSGLFVGADVSTGLCDFKCEPGTQQRLLDGAAACGSTPERALGCYGWAWGTMPLDFTCAADESSAQHGDTPDPLTPQGGPYLNSCDAGYFPWPANFESRARAVCIAFCTPGETHSGDTTNVDGIGANTCGNKGAVGDDMECRYLHIFDVTPPRGEYNASGVCLGTARYVSDWDDDVTTPDTALPRCTQLTNTVMVDSDEDGTPDTPEHEYWGCAPWSDP